MVFSIISGLWDFTMKDVCVYQGFFASLPEQSAHPERFRHGRADKRFEREGLPKVPRNV